MGGLICAQPCTGSGLRPGRQTLSTTFTPPPTTDSLLLLGVYFNVINGLTQPTEVVASGLALQQHGLAVAPQVDGTYAIDDAGDVTIYLGAMNWAATFANGDMVAAFSFFAAGAQIGADAGVAVGFAVPPAT